MWVNKKGFKKCFNSLFKFNVPMSYFPTMNTVSITKVMPYKALKVW